MVVKAFAVHFLANNLDTVPIPSEFSVELHGRRDHQTRLVAWPECGSVEGFWTVEVLGGIHEML